MKVFIKELPCQLDIKSKGMEIDVSDPSGTHVGDLYVTSTKLVWCRGKKAKDNGAAVTWDKFIKWMEQQ